MVRDDEERLSHPSEEISKVSLETLRAKLKLFRMVLIIHCIQEIILFSVLKRKVFKQTREIPNLIGLSSFRRKERTQAPFSSQ